MRITTTDSLYKLLVDSLFECKTSFTKEDLKEKLEEKEINVKDIDLLIEMLLKIRLVVPNVDNTYDLSVEHAFNEVYSKQKAPMET